MSLKNSIITAFIIGGLILVKLFFFPKEEKKKGPQGKGNKTTPVTIYVATTEEFQDKLTTAGTILAYKEALLMPETSGRITLMNIREGTEVSAGELLVKLNDAEEKAQLKKVTEQIKLYEEKKQRLVKLLDIKGISKEEYESLETTLNGLYADKELVQAQLAKKEIKAPFNGIIGLKNIYEGNYVSPSMTIAAIQQINPVQIDFSVPEKYAGQISKGMKLTFSVSESSTTYPAKIEAIEPKIDPTTRTLHVRAIADNKDKKIYPGSFVKINMMMEKRESLMLPTQAIVPVLKGQTVFIAKNGKAEVREVKTGIRTDTSIEITEGIAPGDSVIVTGIMQLKAGDVIKTVKN